MGSRRLFGAAAAFGLVAVLGSAQLALAATGLTLDFSTDLDDADYLEADSGDTFRYDNVITQDGTEVDAILTVGTLTNIGKTNPLDDLDLVDPGIRRVDRASGGQAIDTSMYVDQYGEGTAGFTIAFVDNSDNPVTLTNVEINVVDIDAQQFVTFVSPSSYRLSTNPPTQLTVEEDGSNVTFRGPSESSEDEQEDFWASVTYDSLSTFQYTLGLPVGAVGGSFLITFDETQWTEASSSASDDSSDPTPASQPAIHLDIVETLGTAASTTPVLFEGEGLARGTAYSLRLGSGQVLASGQVDRFGYFSSRVNLPGLAPGSYYVVLQTTAPDGSPLSLTQSFTVGAGGVITSVTSGGATAAGDQLARTGPTDGLMKWGLSLVTICAVVGIALTAAGHGAAARRPVQAVASQSPSV